MRIAIFSDNFYPEMSGIADSIIASAHELAKLGHVIRFYVPAYSEKDFKLAGINSKREIDLDNGVGISRIFSFPYPTPSQQGRMVIPKGLQWLKVKKFKPDIIHSHHFFGVGLEALIAAKILKIPLIGSNHTAITDYVKYAPIQGKRLERISLKYVNWYYGKCILTTSPSKLLIDEMEINGFHGRSETIFNPIDMATFNTTSSIDKEKLKKKFNLNDKTIVYAGRFAPEKNIDVIVKAISFVKEKIPDITLAMAGHGSYFEEIKNLVLKLYLEKNTRFLGTLSHLDLADLYRASEIFSLASTSEIQSMTLIQAMACGLPVIGVRTRGFEYIEENGILIEPGDVKALAEIIIELLENSDLRHELSRRSMQFAKKLSHRNIALTWERIYQREINNLRQKYENQFCHTGL